MKYHEAANLFPMLQSEEYEALKADILKHGIQQPVIVYKGEILDGRNRYKACKDIGIECPTVEYTGDMSPVSYVISMNLHRRHLTQSQAAAVAVEAEEIFKRYSDEAKERQAHGQTAPGQTLVEQIPQALKGKTRDKMAKEFEVNPRYVSDAAKLKKEAPDLFDAVKSGKKTITQAKREIKEKKRQEKREENKKIIEAAPTIKQAVTQAKFSTIVIDPPWDWGDEKDCDQLGRSKPTYDTMSIDKIKKLPIKSISEADAHIYLWITNRSLPKGFGLLEAWGFRYITCLTWCKPSIGMGNYYRGSSEQILFGVKGSLPLARKDKGTWFSAPRGKQHSSKPNEFYELVEMCSPGLYLDVFAREERDGWTAWGGEL